MIGPRIVLISLFFERKDVISILSITKRYYHLVKKGVSINKAYIYIIINELKNFLEVFLERVFLIEIYSYIHELYGV